MTLRSVRWRGALAAPLALAVVTVGAAPPAFDVAASRRIVAAALQQRSLDDARDLTAAAGPRLTGSRTYERATEWAVHRFQDAGLRNVSLEPFTIPRAWERAEARGRIVTPVDRPIAIASLGWVPSTPDAGLTADLIVVTGRTPIEARTVGGRIVLADGDSSPDFDTRLAAAGALALLFGDPDRDNLLTARVRQYGGGVTPLPSATVTREDAALLRRLAGEGSVRVELSWRNVISPGPAIVNSVVAEIAGRERPDEWVLVGAHLDSWDFATGAQDNATGVAMVLDAARTIAALGLRPRRSIRFALWGGEEQGLLGSAAYATAHAAELDRAIAVLNADGGTGRIIGWTTPGREDVQARVAELARPLLGGLDAATIDHGMQYAYDSDGGPFVRAGVPVLDLNVDDSQYEEIHHKRTDTMDRVDARNLAIGTAVVAATAYAIADMPSRLARRIVP